MNIGSSARDQGALMTALCRGMSDAEIAEELGVDLVEVRERIARIFGPVQRF
jgi:DNA-directed RNA polymerase specialized sigma24 family protein